MIYVILLVLLKLILFADDITVFYSNDDISVLCDTVNRELNEVYNWFKCNKLSLNASTTKLMFMGTTYKKYPKYQSCFP